VSPNAQVNVAFSAVIPGTATTGQVYDVVWTVQSDETDLNLADNKSGVGVLIQSGCRALLPRTTYSVAASGDRLRVDVAAAPGCAWSASSAVDWITPASPMPVSGSGLLRVTWRRTRDRRRGRSPSAWPEKPLRWCRQRPAARSQPACRRPPSPRAEPAPLCRGSHRRLSVDRERRAGVDHLQQRPDRVGSGSVPFTTALNPQALPRTGALVVASQQCT